MNSLAAVTSFSQVFFQELRTEFERQCLLFKTLHQISETAGQLYAAELTSAIGSFDRNTSRVTVQTDNAYVHVETFKRVIKVPKHRQPATLERIFETEMRMLLGSIERRYLSLLDTEYQNDVAYGGTVSRLGLESLVTRLETTEGTVLLGQYAFRDLMKNLEEGAGEAHKQAVLQNENVGVIHLHRGPFRLCSDVNRIAWLRNVDNCKAYCLPTPSTHGNAWMDRGQVWAEMADEFIHLSYNLSVGFYVNCNTPVSILDVV